MGVYITLIALMYERAGPISCADMAKLARNCGTSASALASLLGGLIADGKITRDGDMLSNHRAMLEIENVMSKSEVARDKAKGRWQKKPDKSMAAACSGNADAMLVSSQYSIIEETPIIPLSGDTRLNEVRPKKERRKKLAGPLTYSPKFEIFWECYPPVANQSKAKAFEAYSRLDKPDQETAIDGALALTQWLDEEVKRRPNAREFVPHAATWINQRRWETLLETDHRSRYEQRAESP